MSLREIGKELAVSRMTVKRIIDTIEAKDLEIEATIAMTDDQLAAIFIPLRRSVMEFAEPDWEDVYVKAMRKHRPVSLSVLHEDYVRNTPEGKKAMGYSTFTRSFQQYRKALPANLSELAMTFEWKPGEILMIDYSGDGLSYTDASGKAQKIEVFVAVLASSGYIFCYCTPDQKRDSWLTSISEALKFIGGVPECVLTDNASTLVTKASRIEPKFAAEFLGIAAFYGFYPDATRPGRPKDKALVENAVKQSQAYVLDPLLGAQFHSIEEAQLAVSERLAYLNNRKMSEKGQTRREAFEQEKCFLRPLPPVEYESGVIEKCLKVRSDYCIRWKNKRFSVPNEYAEKYVRVQIFPQRHQLDCYDMSTGKRITHHNYGGNEERTVFIETSHMPKGHLAVSHDKGALVELLGVYGPKCKALAEIVVKNNHTRVAVRKLRQMNSEARKLGAYKMEEFCAKVMSRIAPSYEILMQEIDKFRGLSAGETVTVHLPRGVQLDIRQPKKNVRGPDYYANKKGDGNG